MTNTLGYSRYDWKNKNTDNSRNGHSKKILEWINQNGKDEPERRALWGFFVEQYTRNTYIAIIQEENYAHLSDLVILKMRIESLINKYKIAE